MGKKFHTKNILRFFMVVGGLILTVFWSSKTEKDGVLSTFNSVIGVESAHADTSAGCDASGSTDSESASDASAACTGCDAGGSCDGCAGCDACI